MKGQLRIRDSSSEREIELGRDLSQIGVSRNGQVSVGPSMPDQTGLSLQWDARQATWVLRVAFALSIPAVVNTRRVNPGEEIPLSNLDTIQFPRVLIQFQRVLAPPMCGGEPASRVSLDSQPLVIGRGELKKAGDPSHIDLDPEENIISRAHVAIECENGEYFIRDTSRTGTELNGRALTKERLVFGDRFRI